MQINWLWRLKRWVQNPPSRRTIQIFAVSTGIVVVLALLEYFGVFPDDLGPQSMKMPPIK